MAYFQHLLFFCLLLKFSHAALTLPEASQSLWLTIAYPPNEFGDAGAIVKVDPQTGSWTLAGKFKWPGQLNARPYFYDPAMSFDPESGLLYLCFGADFGFVVVVDVENVKVIDHFMHSDPFFIGYTNMKYVHSSNTLVGTSPVGNDDGIFSFGTLNLASHKYVNQSLILFKAMMDDSDFYDPQTNIYFVQADYDQRTNPMCPGGTELCILHIDSQTGHLLRTVKSNYTIYQFSHNGASSSVSSVLAWIEGFESFCPSSQSSFLFANVNLLTGSATPLACLESSIIIQEEPWISCFSDDDTLFATGSRFAQMTQLLVIDVKTGHVLLNGTLPGLAKELHAAEGMYYIWDMTFI